MSADGLPKRVDEIRLKSNIDDMRLVHDLDAGGEIVWREAQRAGMPRKNGRAFTPEELLELLRKPHG